MKKPYRDPLLTVIGYKSCQMLAGISTESDVNSAPISDGDDESAF